MIQAGQRIGAFEVLALASHGALGKHRRFFVRCEHGVESEKATNDIRRQKRCGCQIPADRRKWLYSHLKTRQASRSGEVISFEHFCALIEQSCFYCGSPPSNSLYDVTYSGIDRADNTRGYVTGNVRPCCSTCNWMKGDLTEQQFYAHIAKIKEPKS